MFMYSQQKILFLALDLKFFQSLTVFDNRAITVFPKISAYNSSK